MERINHLDLSRKLVCPSRVDGAELQAVMTITYGTELEGDIRNLVWGQLKACPLPA